MKARTLALLCVLGFSAARPDNFRHLTAYVDMSDDDDNDDTDWEDTTITNRKEIAGMIGKRG